MIDGTRFVEQVAGGSVPSVVIRCREDKVLRMLIPLNLVERRAG
jgi:hypothetical protein